MGIFLYLFMLKGNDLWVNILDVLENVVNGMVKYFLFGFFKIGLSNI